MTLELLISHYYVVAKAKYNMPNALATNSYCTNPKCASDKSITKDQRTGQSLGDSMGPCKTVPMERMAGRMAAEEVKMSVSKAMSGVASSIDRS